MKNFTKKHEPLVRGYYFTGNLSHLISELQRLNQNVTLEVAYDIHFPSWQKAGIGYRVETLLENELQRALYE